MVKDILVTGSSGLVGSRFIELFSQPSRLLTPTEEEFNLLNPASIKSYLKINPVKYLVNFGAYTDVAAAEKERGNKSGLCWKLNVEGVRNIITAIDPKLIHIIQVSTDMVFPGTVSDPGPYPEYHQPESESEHLTWYGFTKMQAELLIKPIGTVVRICNPVRANYQAKLDYFRKPLSLFDQGKLYPLFTDQYVTISYIDEISMALELLISKNLIGIFHFSSSDLVTPFSVIKELISKIRGSTESIAKSSVLNLNNPVRYPQFAGLKCETTESELGLKFSSTSQIIDKLISQGLS